MSTNIRSPRKQVYVNRTIQGRMLRRFAVMWFVYHLVLWHAMFLYRYLQYRGELLAGAPAQPFADLYSAFFLTHYSVLICALAVLPVLLWDMIRMTHRVAGPLVRFQRALAELAEGRPVQRVQIRKGDLLIEFQDSFNEFLEKIGMAEPPQVPSAGQRGAAEAPATHAPRQDEHTQVIRELRDVQQTVAQGVEPVPAKPASSTGLPTRA